MADDLNTLTLQGYIDRFRAGEMEALNSLILRTQERLEKLARRMLRDYPGVRAKEQTGDVVNSALIRLGRALLSVKPASVREFYGLAAEQIRRELLDLVRRYKCRPAESLGEADLEGREESIAEMERWAALQEAVDTLPTDQREVFCLTFYHGWTKAQIAELLQVSESPVKRLWKEACQRLATAVGGQFPSM